MIYKIVPILMLLSTYNNVKAQRLAFSRPFQNFMPFSWFGGGPVRLDVYYETHCPSCIHEFQGELPTLMSALSSYVDLHTHPFGNAKMNFTNGGVQFDSQHGPVETYGNKLQACAINSFGSDAAALGFNACMMSLNSNDSAADQCGRMFNIDPTPIKMCAQGPMGDLLLYQQGMESAKVSFKTVPAVYINGRPKGTENLLASVCNAIENPPPVCRGLM